MDRLGLIKYLGPVVSPLGLEIDDLEVAPVGKRRVVRITVDGDGPAGRGPDLDLVAEATRAVSVALDDADFSGQSPYTLEVSTRGVSRPLTRPVHYRRNRGRLVAFSLSDGEKLTVRILSADEAGVEVDLAGTQRRIAFEQITRAVVQVEMNRPVDEDEE